MAAKSDGSVALDVNLNVDQAYKGLEKIRRKVEEIQNDIAAKETRKSEIEEELKAAGQQADAAKAKIEDLKKSLNETLETQKNALVTQVQKYEQERSATTDRTRQKELEQLAQAEQKRVEAIENLQKQLETRDYQFTQSMRDRAADLLGQDALADVDALKEQQTLLKQSEKNTQKLKKEQEKVTEEIKLQNAALGRQQELEVRAQRRLASAQTMEPVNEVIAGTQETFNRFMRTITNSMRRLFFFSIFYTGFRQVRDGMLAMVKTSDETMKALARLKGAFLTLVNPLITRVIPALTAAANAVSYLLESLAELTAYLFGTTAQEAAKAAEALYDEANGLNEVKDAAEEAEGSLAAFDKINTINTEPKLDKTEETARPDFSAFDTSKFKTAFDRFRAMLATGIAMLVIGAILTFTGVNIPVGIALMAAGAAMIYAAVALNWNAMDGPTKERLAKLVTTIGVFMAVIGVILLLTGNVPVGLALIIAGAYIFGAGVMAANWDTMDATLNERLGKLAETVGIFLAVIGVILLLTGHFAIGIGLIIFGIVLFKTGEAALQWDSLGETMKEKLAAVLEKIGETLIVIGIILLFVPGQLILGLGLIVAGAAALDAAKILLEWESLGGTLEEKLAAVVEKIADYMIVFGILLLFVPTQFLTGIALIAGGVSILAAKEVYLNWDSFGDTIEEKIIGVLDTIKYYMLVIGFLLLFVPGSRILGLGLIVAGIAVISVTEVSEDENGFQKSTEEKLFSLVKIISGALAVLGIILMIFGGPAFWPLALGMFAVGNAVFGVALRSPDWNALKNKLVEMWTNIKRWFTTDVKKYLSVDYWAKKAGDIISGIVKGITSGISAVGNAIAGLFTKATSYIAAPASFTRSGSIPTASAASASTYPAAIRAADVPALARGAVIPANREFLAVLGDQRNGRNLEAPEGLLREINREGNAEVVAILAQILAAIQAGQVIQVDGQTFGRTAQRTLNNITNASGAFALNW